MLTSKWTSDDLEIVERTGTAQGKPVSFPVSGGQITVDGAKIVKSNIERANGVPHAIDTVLLPPGRTMGICRRHRPRASGCM